MIKQIIEMKIITEKEVGVDLEKDHFQGILVIEEMTEAQTVDQDQDQEQVLIIDRIRCYKCREYYHFAKDFPKSKEEREIELIQQMFNLNEGTDIINMMALTK